jgi:hypothetical protein
LGAEGALLSFPIFLRFPGSYNSHAIIEAALGWFQLGNYVEAFTELDNLPPEHCTCIEAMELRCRIYRKLEKWWELEIVAQGCSGREIGHIPFACHHAWALMKQGRADEAEVAPRNCCSRKGAWLAPKESWRQPERCFQTPFSSALIKKKCGCGFWMSRCLSRCGGQLNEADIPLLHVLNV